MADQLRAGFDVLDTDKDGFVSFEQLEAAIIAKAGAEHADKVKGAFGPLDKDGDGKLSFTDFSGLAEEPYKSGLAKLFL